jgi:chromatin remodeling complex protein RSC6
MMFCTLPDAVLTSPLSPRPDHDDHIQEEERVTMSAPKKSTTRSTVGKGSESEKNIADKQSQRKGLLKPMQPDEDLAAIVGPEPLPRTEITRRVWDYIRKNQLQDPVNKRLINADDRLLRVLDGKQQVTMFEMTRLVSKHVRQTNE